MCVCVRGFFSLFRVFEPVFGIAKYQTNLKLCGQSFSMFVGRFLFCLISTNRLHDIVLCVESVVSMRSEHSFINPFNATNEQSYLLVFFFLQFFFFDNIYRSTGEVQQRTQFNIFAIQGDYFTIA